MRDPQLCRPVPGTLALNSRELLIAADNQICKVLGGEKLVDDVTEERDGRISRAIGVVLRADEEESDENVENSNGEWCDIGDQSSIDWELALKSKLLESQSYGIVWNGCGCLEFILR